MNVPAGDGGSPYVTQPGGFGAGSLCRNARARGADDLRRGTGAGVAPSTVSRALSKPDRVSYKTAEHVRQLAEQVGYRTGRMSARSPSAGRDQEGR